MTDYGVKPTGFVRKPLAVILAEREEKNRAVFGNNTIQTAQSPLGEFNGIVSALVAELWEIAEDVYQSYDPDQASGTRLETLARLRLIERAMNEGDASLAQAITNAGVANVRDADFYRSVLNVSGVVWAQIYSNETGETDDNGMPRNSVTVAAIGGENTEIATIARRFIIPGITVFGNTAVDTNIDGFCRTIRIMRPTERRVRAEITINKKNGARGCPPPSNAAIAATFANEFLGIGRPDNGADLSVDLVRRSILCAHENVSVTGVRFAFDDDDFANAPLAIGFDEIASVTVSDITVLDT